MFFRLVLLFTLLPLLELYLLIEVGRVVGAGRTIFLVLATGVLGAALARREGWRTWQQIQLRVSQGGAPTGELVDGGLILAAGLLLITPGILTDIVGFVLLFPPTRSLIKVYCRRKLEEYARTTHVEIHVDRWP